jgi:glycosyltransferase involved in cell wall biosynthesis
MPPLISFCCTIKNRADKLTGLVNSLAAMENAEPFELIIADYHSNDRDLREILTTTFPTALLTLRGGHFNRSQGLNAAAAQAAGTLLFFIDVDMLVPTDFATQIREKVRNGNAWFPVCYSLHNGCPAKVVKSSRSRRKGANGWWRKEGKGNCGITKDEFEKIGRWDERIGVTYGKEDGDFCRRVCRSGINGERGNCVGLFHVWHPLKSTYSNQYHRKGGQTRASGKRKGRVNPQPEQPEIAVWRATPQEV